MAASKGLIMSVKYCARPLAVLVPFAMRTTRWKSSL